MRLPAPAGQTAWSNVLVFVEFNLRDSDSPELYSPEMPNMLVTPRMCEVMEEVLASDSLTSEERSLLVQFLWRTSKLNLAVTHSRFQEGFGTKAKSYPMPVIELMLKKHPSKF